MTAHTISYDKLKPDVRFDTLNPGDMFSHSSTVWMKLGNIQAGNNAKAVDLKDGMVGTFYDYQTVLKLTTPVTIS